MTPATYSRWSIRAADCARRLATRGQHLPAMRALAVADAAHRAAGGDKQGKRLALADARFYRRAMRARVRVPA
jgi:hypothetical protein